jgi:hypothetical protein
MLIYTVVAVLPAENSDGRVRKLAERIAKGYGKDAMTPACLHPPAARPRLPSRRGWVCCPHPTVGSHAPLPTVAAAATTIINHTLPSTVHLTSHALRPTSGPLLDVLSHATPRHTTPRLSLLSTAC